MGQVVLDASVIISVFDPEDAMHATMRDLVRDRHFAGDDFCVPASVLSEVLVGQARLGNVRLGKRIQDIEKLFGRSRPIDDDVAVASAQLRAKHRSLRLPDSLVIAVGIVEEADAVLTADKRWNGIDKRVEVVSG